jgi:5'-nucleotidase / UDP-sugar diphosphatase
MHRMEQPASALTLRMASTIEEVQRKGVPHVVDFVILQLNDVYEAPPVEGGRLGGVARAATLRRQLEQENPNLLTLMIGDFLAPSPIGATTGDAGQHMVEALNAMGLTHATMGNHEFDVTEADLKERIAESRFKWIVSNVKNVVNGEVRPFDRVAEHEVVEFANAAGERVRVALIGVCLDMVKKPWLSFKNPIESAREQVALLESKADVFVAMTHLTMPEDRLLGTEVPRLDVLMGGHEHETATAIVGGDSTPIFKADSNARSAFVHRFRFDTQARVTTLFSQLVKIDASFEEDPETAAIVHRWQTSTYETLRAQGFDPLQVVGRATEDLDGYEAAVRSRPTNLTQLIGETFLAEVPGADAVVFTAGLVRIDGIIPAGDVTYYDIVRIFPTGGKLSVLQMPGKALRAFLEIGESSKGTGGFQIRANIRRDGSGAWSVKDAPIADEQLYKIVMTEFPAAYLSYPPFKGTGTTKLFDTRETRAILTDRLKRDLTRV